MQSNGSNETLLHLQPTSAAMGLHTKSAQVPERYQQEPQLLLPTVYVQAVVSGWMGVAVESGGRQV